MTTKQLQNRILVLSAGYGHKKIHIEFRNKKYWCISTNTMATDRITQENSEDRTPKSFYTTKKQALLSLYNECKRVNNL